MTSSTPLPEQTPQPNPGSRPSQNTQRGHNFSVDGQGNIVAGGNVVIVERLPEYPASPTPIQKPVYTPLPLTDAPQGKRQRLVLAGIAGVILLFAFATQNLDNKTVSNISFAVTLITALLALAGGDAANFSFRRRSAQEIKDQNRAQ